MRWLWICVALLGAYLWLGRSAYVGEVTLDGHYAYPGYQVRVLEEFQLSARVLSKRFYDRGREAELSPVDLALGWDQMSQPENIAQLSITQRNRWFYWRAEQLPLPRGQLESSMANVHIIPATPAIAQALEHLTIGSMVALEGDLVEVEGADGWRWRSSLSRFDTGDNSCELLVLRKLVLASPN